MDLGRRRKVTFVLCLAVVALLVLTPSALADLTGGYECQNWNSTVLLGPLNVTITPSAGPSSEIEFSYEAPKPYNYALRRAEFSVTATRSGTISFDWEYYFHHGWWQSYADLWVYADGPSGRTWQHLVDFYDLDWGEQTFTGSASINVTEGYAFGFRVEGKNYDYSQKLKGTVTLTNFELPVLPVVIDIKPGSFPNSFNANGRGVIPVAILGSADLDVVDVNPSSLRFEGAAVRVKGNGSAQCSLQDVYSQQGPPDGYLDLVCQFVDNFTDGWPLGDGTATVNGRLFDGHGIVGTDSITIVP